MWACPFSYLRRSGYRVLGLDIDQAKAEAINQGQSYIEHIDGERVSRASQDQRFEATIDFSRAAEADAVILCAHTSQSISRA